MTDAQVSPSALPSGQRPGPTRAGDRPSVARPRLGAVSFLHRFGSALNHHVHLHACATDGVFVPTGDGPPALLRASRLPT